MMLAKDLIEILNKFPNYGVEVETESVISPVVTVEIDCFDRNEGFVFVITPEGV